MALYGVLRKERQKRVYFFYMFEKRADEIIEIRKLDFDSKEDQ